MIAVRLRWHKRIERSTTLIYAARNLLRQSLACCRSAAVSMPSNLEYWHTIEHATATTSCERSKLRTYVLTKRWRRFTFFLGKIILLSRAGLVGLSHFVIRPAMRLPPLSFQLASAV
jgi:hypothetical protein